MPKSITVIGRRWFQKSYGNTYHTAQILVDGVPVEGVGRSYGYGDMYLQNAADKLEALGYMPNREHYAHGGATPLWRYCEEHGIVFTCSVMDVQRQKDL